MEPQAPLSAVIAYTFGYYVAAMVATGAAVTVFRLFWGGRP
ncbi:MULTISPECIES: hypothetical protein [unclassified Chelatococcus]|nr:MULTISPECIES: hypothetical protein [unclassified Chelatococcus]